MPRPDPKMFFFVLFLMMCVGCATTTTPSDSVYEQKLAEIEAEYTEGKISQEEYDRLKRELDHTDGGESPTLLDLWWGD